MTNAPRRFRVWDPCDETTEDTQMIEPPHRYVLYGSSGDVGPDAGWPNDNLVPLFYTGLDDAEGTEIYEGDVVYVDERYWDNSVIEPVEGHTGFFIRCYNRPNDDPRPIPSRDPLNQRYIDKLSLTVIGNRFENPELLEEVAA